MSTIVKGENVIVEIYDDGDWKPYACGLGCTFTVTTDFIETSVTGAGKYRSYEPTANSFTGNISGFTHLGIAGSLSLADLRARQLSHTKLRMRFQRTSNDGLIYTTQAYFFISNSTDDGQNEGINTFNVDLRGTGALTQLTTRSTTSGRMNRTPTWTTSGGETSHVFTELIDKNVIEIVVDGVDIKEIITSGSPATEQAKFEDTTGTVTFPFALPAAVKVYATYQDL